MATRAKKPPHLDATMRTVILRGPDQFLRDAYTRRLVEALEKEHGAVEQFRFDGSAAEIASVLDELRSYGLLQDHKLVIVDQADVLLAKKKDEEEDGKLTPGGKRKKTARELLEQYVADPIESATLVLRASTWRPGRLDKAVTAGGGAIVVCDQPDASGAAAWCLARAEKTHERLLEPKAATALVDRIGNDLSRLDVELAKLAAFVGEEAPITDTAVREMVGQTREEEVWALQSAILTGDASVALGKLRELMIISRQPEALVTWAMTDLVRKIHAATRARADGQSAAVVSKSLKLWGSSQRAILDVAGRVDPADAARLLDLVLETDRRTKRGVGNHTRSLEALAVQIADRISSQGHVRKARMA